MWIIMNQYFCNLYRFYKVVALSIVCFSVLALDDSKLIPPGKNTSEGEVLSSGLAFRTHKVVPGDNLTYLSERYSVSVIDLKKINNLDSDLLIVGSKLKIPSLDTRTHKVVPGDNLTYLSERYSVSVIDLKKINNLDSDLLIVGSKLKIPRSVKLPDNIDDIDAPSGEILSGKNLSQKKLVLGALTPVEDNGRFLSPIIDGSVQKVNEQFDKFSLSIQDEYELGESQGTLQEVIYETSKHSPEVLKKGYDVESLRYAIKGAQSAKYPTIDLSVRGGREENFKRSADGTKNSGNRMELSITAIQNLYDGGKKVAEVNRVKASHESNAHQLQQIRQDAALKAAFVYLDVIRFREILDTAISFTKENFRARNIAGSRLAQGASDASEFQNIEGRLENSKANYISALNNFEDSRSRFKAVAGYLPAFYFSPDNFVLNFVEKDMIPSTVNETISLALAKHPTMLAAAADIKEAKYQHKRTRAEVAPEVNFELAGTQNENEYYGGATTSDRQYATAMLTLKYNIFDGGKGKAMSSEMMQLLSSAESLAEQKEREVEDSARLAWRSYALLLKQMKPLENELDAAIVAVGLVDRQFSVGRAKLIDSIDKREIAFEAQVNHISAKYDFLYAGFRVLHATGTLLSEVNN
jgi:adhesin transport system outer membrane protein